MTKVSIPKPKSFTSFKSAKMAASTIAGMKPKVPKQKTIKFKAPPSIPKPPTPKMPKVSTNGGPRPPKQSASKQNIFNSLK